ncbi:hypothetical protein [Bacillus infantis]|uniref:hypothetical protein n=1 Tax=Bacillus infantis TaxID=324767 RepID=UPI00321B9358
MLGINLNLNEKDTSLASVSLTRYIPTLRDTEKPIFNKAYEKLQHNNIMDGMYMRCLEQALSFLGSKECLKLAAFIEQRRLEFQTTTFNLIRRKAAAGGEQLEI